MKDTTIFAQVPTQQHIKSMHLKEIYLKTLRSEGISRAQLKREMQLSFPSISALVDELLNDGDKLIRFISGGLVFTGNDNSDTEQRCFINRDEEFLEDYDWNTKTTEQIKNPYYMSNHEDYEWYWKGN